MLGFSSDEGGGIIMPVPKLDSPNAEEREILEDPEVQKALAALDDPEDREDLIDALIVQKRIDEGKETTVPWEEVQRKLGL
jgi:hypothetical protein